MARHAKDEDDFRRAAAMQNRGDSAGAFALYRKLYPRHQKSPEFLIHMAIAAVGLGKHARARKLVQSILRLRPDAGSAHNVLGIVALNEKNVPAAIKHFHDFVASAPTSVEARLNLGEALNKNKRAVEAAVHQARACELAPDRADVFYAHATTLLALGQLKQAVQQFRHALSLDPNCAGAWKMLAELRQLDADSDLKAMSESLDRLKDDHEALAKMHFALATFFEHQKKYDQSFSHLDRANHLVRASLNYDVAHDEQLMGNIATTFTAELIERLSATSQDSKRPIFIVGMPRSGTTLVERILAGHSDVYGGGELSYMADAVAMHGARGPHSYPHSARKWTQNTQHAIAKSYLRHIDDLCPDSPRITDKMPSNFLYLGVIRTVFPHAAIVHCRRNPVDTCLGNFRQMFTTGQHFSYAMDDLVRYYTAYQGLMNHWRSLFGDAILDVQYEDVVQAPEDLARRIIKHCDLDWQYGCVNFNTSESAIYTASATQVRDGIHTQFLERWRKYEAHIQPLLDGLG